MLLSLKNICQLNQNTDLSGTDNPMSLHIKWDLNTSFVV